MMEPLALPNLATEAFGHHCLHFAALPSTNDYLKAHAAEFPHGTVALADCQTAGRGRQGRTWAGQAPGQSLQFSILLHWPLTQNPAVLSLVTGLAVARALHACYKTPFFIKWPNDLLYNMTKIGGILAEGVECLAFLHKRAIICGVGINLLQDQAFFDALSLPQASSLYLATGLVLDPLVLLGAILKEWEPLFQQCRQQGFAPLRPAYEPLCINLGKEQRFFLRGEPKTGYARRIGDDGALWVEFPEGERPLYGGEVSVRGLNGYL